jgi:hypothetical protein
MIVLVNRPRIERTLWVAALAALLAAVCLAAVNVFSVWTARTEVPWRDQWTYLEDAKQILAHDWPRLWYCYWGGRYVSVRAITVATVNLFSKLNMPVIASMLAGQTAYVALLVYIAWRLAGSFSKPVFLIAAALMIQFGFSSLQLENFMWAGQVGYVLGWACATAAFYFLAAFAEAGGKKAWALAACIGAGIVSTASTPAGLFVWPTLILQSWILRLSQRTRVLLIATCVLITVVYFRGYEGGPPLGMGLLNAVRKPWQSIPIVGMLIAAPLTAVSDRLAELVGCVTLVVTLVTLLRAMRGQPPAMVTVPTVQALFALLSFGSVVASRISPEFIAQREALHLVVIPSRYYTFVFFFWAGIVLVSIWLAINSRRQWPQLASLGTLALVFTFGTSIWQIGEAANWRGYYRELDVGGSALIMHVDDPSNRYLAEIYPDAVLRSRMSTWLEERGKAIFSERRAHLIGERVKDIAGDEGRCQGEIQSVVPLAGGVIRLAGWIVDTKTGAPPRDIVFADPSGAIVGIARSGLRRPDLQGKAGAAPLETTGWQGYARIEGKNSITAYGVLNDSDAFCRAGYRAEKD